MTGLIFGKEYQERRANRKRHGKRNGHPRGKELMSEYQARIALKKEISSNEIVPVKDTVCLSG